MQAIAMMESPKWSFGSIWRCSYDLHILSQLHGQSIVPADFRAALIATAKKRGTEEHLADAPAAFDEVEADSNMEKLWRAYQKKFSYAADLSWHTFWNPSAALSAGAGVIESSKSEFLLLIRTHKMPQILQIEISAA